jgi:RNA polymerase sigma-70 factor (ECF subfamily)
MMQEAEALLREAARAATPGRLQLEAAIQSVHAQRAATGQTDWQAIVALYGLLAQLSPTVGVQVARAAALAEAGDPAPSLALLDALAATDYQPWWACRARALTLLGRRAEAQAAFRHAAGLSMDPAVRAWLLAQAEA